MTNLRRLLAVIAFMGVATSWGAGDAARGREIFMARDGGHCVLCHSAPGIPVAGNVGPPLAGVGARLTPEEIRARIADITRINPDAAMPAFHRKEGLERVAPDHAGRPVLDERQLDDLVAWLSTLTGAAASGTGSR